MPAPVVSAVTEWYAAEAADGGYELADARKATADGVYGSIATLINAADPSEIACVENATRAWDMAFYSMEFNAGDRILTSMAEYCSNYLAFLHVCEKTGALVQPIPDGPEGGLSVDALRGILRDNAAAQTDTGGVTLIAVTHVPTNGGLVNPVEKIGALAAEFEIPYLVDACQSVGQLELDVQKIQCDALSATSRKYLRGPRGIGFLYCRKDSPWMQRAHPPFVDVQAAEWTTASAYTLTDGARKFENWERNFAAWIGLGVAVEYAMEIGMARIERRCIELGDALRSELRGMDGVTVTDVGEKTCGIVSFTVEGVAALAVKAALLGGGFRVTHSTVSGTRLDMEARGIEEVVRASCHYYNTEDEVRWFAQVLREAMPALVAGDTTARL
jgi:selenocysteine lyase/cysteine desulfurase